MAFSDAVKRSDTGGERKLASRVTDRIISDIRRHDWRPGTVIGAEAELLERYDISRAVFRESVRLLEHLGLATTRRGPGGGLVVSEPSTNPVVQAFLVYLTYQRVSLGELMDARKRIEAAIARLAAERADDTDVTALRELVVADRERGALDPHAHHALHTMIAHVARNPVAELFTDVLGRLTARWSYPARPTAERHGALDAAARAHERIVDAITVGDAGAAERRMVAHLDGLGDWIGRHRAAPKSLDWVLDDSAGDKLASQVARAIIVDIVDRNWPIGEVLGSETELIDRYQVSRSALREAVRVLEYHEVATMRRGPGGGLVVTTPSADPIVRAATVFLDHRGITPGDLISMRRDLESEAVGLAAERVTPADVERLRALVEANAVVGFTNPIDDDISVNIARLGGNPAIALFVRVLVELSLAQIGRAHV